MDNQGLPRKKKLLRKLRHKYRLVMMNDETLEESYSIRLSPLRLFTAAGLLAIGLILLTSYIIAFTPLREYIPGYSSDVRMRRIILNLAEKVDSLQKDAMSKDLLLQNIRMVIDGGTAPDGIVVRTPAKPDMQTTRLSPSSSESAFRKAIDAEDKYDLNANAKETMATGIYSFYFFTPLKGRITTHYNPGEKHYGVDIVAARNEAVKATLDGTVIFAGWNSTTGHVIQLQHAEGLISIYKHNAVLLKKEGDVVKAGEAIAITGNSGELTTGPHLHFEIWLEGKPLDPEDLMVF